jgi:threonine aldolase
MPPRPDNNPRAKELGKIFARCDRFLAGHGPLTPKDAMRALFDELEQEEQPDYYGFGDILKDFEGQIAQILGKEAAVFMPSGTMAQQIALRVWCDRKRLSTVAFHPSCHLELHVADGLEHLHGIHRALIGESHRLITVDDLAALKQPISTLLLELPQREIGGFLPSWEELTAQCQWAAEKGVKVHMDGARLWESQPFYGRSHAEISSLFDSVYVSCYKGLGGLAGAVLAGPGDFIEEARIWQQRHGGALIHHYPYIVAARAGLRERLPRFASYHQSALAVGEILRSIPGVTIKPDLPHTHMMHVYLQRDKSRAIEASAKIARDYKVRLFNRLSDCELPGYCKFELALGDAVTALSEKEIEELFRRVLELSK